MSCIKIPLAIFDTFCWVYYGDKGQKQFNNVVVNTFDDEPFEFPPETVGRSHGGIIWIKSLDLIPTLVHEANHFVDSFLSHKGIDDPSGEVKSYLLGYITKYVMKFKEREK